jgi:hypothetical protein
MERSVSPINAWCVRKVASLIFQAIWQFGSTHTDARYWRSDHGNANLRHVSPISDTKKNILNFLFSSNCPLPWIILHAAQNYLSCVRGSLSIILIVKAIDDLLVSIWWSRTHFILQQSNHGISPKSPEISWNTLSFVIQQCVDTILALPINVSATPVLHLQYIARCKNCRCAQPWFRQHEQTIHCKETNKKKKIRSMWACCWELFLWSAGLVGALATADATYGGVWPLARWDPSTSKTFSLAPDERLAVNHEYDVRVRVYSAHACVAVFRLYFFLLHPRGGAAGAPRERNRSRRVPGALLLPYMRPLFSLYRSICLYTKIS